MTDPAKNARVNASIINGTVEAIEERVSAHGLDRDDVFLIITGIAVSLIQGFLPDEDPDELLADLSLGIYAGIKDSDDDLPPDTGPGGSLH